MTGAGQPAAGPEEQAVLAANAAFYRAFAEGDMAAMDGLWSRVHAVVCVHPGWDALTDRRAVMESWQAILGHGSSRSVGAAAARVYRHGEVAFVTCRERIERNAMVATNVFVREEAGWKLVHHHASPLLRPPPGGPPPRGRPPGTVH